MVLFSRVRAIYNKHLWGVLILVNVQLHLTFGGLFESPGWVEKLCLIHIFDWDQLASRNLVNIDTMIILDSKKKKKKKKFPKCCYPPFLKHPLPLFKKSVISPSRGFRGSWIQLGTKKHTDELTRPNLQLLWINTFLWQKYFSKDLKYISNSKVPSKWTLK